SKEGLVGCESKTNEGLDESSIGRARTACGSFSNSARTLRRRFAPRKILANNAPRRKSLPAMRQCHSLLEPFPDLDNVHILPAISSVNNTQIVARVSSVGTHFLAYQMNYESHDENAMILPIPVRQPARAIA